MWEIITVTPQAQLFTLTENDMVKLATNLANAITTERGEAFGRTQGET